MKAWTAFALLALVACGGGGGSGAGGPTTPAARGSRPGGGAADLRARVQALCGAGFQASLPAGPHGTGEGCDFVKVDGWRGRAVLEAQDQRVLRVAVTLVGPAAAVEDMRTRALALVGDLLDDKERSAVQRALARLYPKTETAADNAGWLGDLYVRASTEIEVQHPRERWVELSLETARAADDGRAGFREVGAELFDTPAKAVTPAWIADAKAACTELVTFVSKRNKLEVAPPKWTEGELHVECMHPDENIVAQFVATWAPTTRQLLYLRFVADAPQKQFSAYTERLLAPLISPAQLAVARTAAKKAPLDRRYEADGLQFGSRHDTGGFFGEEHELELTVQIGYTDDDAGDDE